MVTQLIVDNGRVRVETFESNPNYLLVTTAVVTNKSTGQQVMFDVMRRLNPASKEAMKQQQIIDSMSDPVEHEKVQAFYFDYTSSLNWTDVEKQTLTFDKVLQRFSTYGAEYRTPRTYIEIFRNDFIVVMTTPSFSTSKNGVSVYCAVTRQDPYLRILFDRSNADEIEKPFFSTLNETSKIEDIQALCERENRLITLAYGFQYKQDLWNMGIKL